MSWLYNGKPFEPTPEDIKPYVGFVYLITNLDDDDKMYIGKKVFWNSKRRHHKGKARAKIVKVQSDWRSYIGSSTTLPKGKLKKEILHLCKTKGDLSYVELWEQMRREALLRQEYYNGAIRVKFHHSTLSKESLLTLGKS